MVNNVKRMFRKEFAAHFFFVQNCKVFRNIAVGLFNIIFVLWLTFIFMLKMVRNCSRVANMKLLVATQLRLEYNFTAEFLWKYSATYSEFRNYLEGRVNVRPGRFVSG
jgi:hypothetical protein